MNAHDAALLRSDLERVGQILGAFATQLGAAVAAVPRPPLPAPVAAPLPVRARQPRRCGYCRRPGHTQRFCALKDADTLRLEELAERHRNRVIAAAALVGAPVPAAAPPAQARAAAADAAAGRFLQLDVGGHRFVPSVQAECPVCLETKECCRLACDHPLCGSCVKLQWENNLRSCGLCRAALAPK